MDDLLERALLSLAPDIDEEASRSLFDRRRRRDRHRRRARLAGMLGVAALIGGGVAVVAGGAPSVIVQTDVADDGVDTAVPADALPQDVARAYLTAIQEGDEAAGTLLLTEKLAARYSAPNFVGGWFENVRSLTEVRIGEPRPDEASDGREAVFVPVEFHLRQHEIISMLDGDTVWGYRMVRTEPDGAWRIDDEGPV